MPDKYLFVGAHADSLASGRPVAPYEELDQSKPSDKVDPDDPHDAALIAEGKLLNVDPQPDELTGEELQRRARDLNIEGRSKMSTEDLRAAIAKAEKEAERS